MRPSFTIAAALAGALAAGTALAEPAATNPPAGKQDADQCILDYFNKAVEPFADLSPGVTVTLNYDMAQFNGIKAYCENSTQTKATLFNGINHFSMTLGNVRFNFK